MPLLLAGTLGLALASDAASARTPQADGEQLRCQRVRPLSGALDDVPMLNDNNPELIREPGILLSTFDAERFGSEGSDAHLNLPLSGRFDLFSHHVYAGRPDRLDSTLWLAVVAAPATSGTGPIALRLLEGATSLSQATRQGQVAAPFLPLPPVIAETTEPVFSGPGSRVAGELLRGESTAQLPQQWTIDDGPATVLLTLPLPVEGLDPLLNGRNLQLRLESDGPLSVATLATYGPPDAPPSADVWRDLLASGRFSPREHSPTPRGAPGGIVYSRVNGVQLGQRWQATLTSPESSSLRAADAPVSWPISSLERGRLGTGQVQTAELERFVPDTAWAAHGNYGVEYDLTLPLHNDGDAPVALDLALESPVKTDEPIGGLRFRSPPGKAVMFRGPVEVSGLDGASGRPAGARRFHLVARQGQAGPALGRITLAPGEERRVRVRLIYPADATPPQVLSLLPVKQSPAISSPCP
ncbi:DUF3370 domain-containing protein [Synechococcus sp. RSCCF101]|nr:DUF3370 domain-containing protein [Synechococcus sp. RSCCF101]